MTPVKRLRGPLQGFSGCKGTINIETVTFFPPGGKIRQPAAFAHRINSRSSYFGISHFPVVQFHHLPTIILISRGVRSCFAIRYHLWFYFYRFYEYIKLKEFSQFKMFPQKPYYLCIVSGLSNELNPDENEKAQTNCNDPFFRPAGIYESGG